MLNLLKSDFYRITRPRGLRGSFWQYAIAIACVYAFIVFLYFLIQSPDLSSLADSEGLIDALNTYATPTQFLASMFSGIAPLCTSFLVVEHALSDFKAGFVKSVVSARQGRLSYFLEKILFAGAASAFMILVDALLVGIVGLVIGVTFTGTEPILGTIGWAISWWLNTWALSAIPLVLVYATRISPLSYIGSLVCCFGWIPALLRTVATMGGSLLRVVEPFAPALETLAAWMPSSAITCLERGGMLLSATSDEVWGAARALTINPMAQSILTGIIWIAIATALVLIIARKRDI